MTRSAKYLADTYYRTGDNLVIELIDYSVKYMAKDGYCVAVDFDGTLCDNAFPSIGMEKFNVIRDLKFLHGRGIKLILWTCRSGELLSDAVKWCSERGLSFDAVNENIRERIDLYGTDPRKVGADEYWDDKAVRID